MSARPALALALLVAPGCVSAYRPPSATEPHATLKVRRVYETRAGTTLHEQVAINGHPAYHQSPNAALADAPRTDALRVHPSAAKLDLHAGFAHQELRTVTETYTQQVPYTATESYSCGTGTSYRTCSRSVTHHRSETRTRTVLKSVEVSDGTCGRALALLAEAGHVYLVDFTYQDHGVCNATCVEQIGAGAEGSFQTRPCPVPTQAQLRQAE